MWKLTANELPSEAIELPFIDTEGVRFGYFENGIWYDLTRLDEHGIGL